MVNSIYIVQCLHLSIYEITETGNLLLAFDAYRLIVHV